jgi:hypothetical protein
MFGFHNKPVRYLLQAFNYSVFMALIWYFATEPSIRILADDEAMITIAFAHAGELREPCRKLSNEELQELAPNMRKPEECPRERSPVLIEVLVDEQRLYAETFDPPGLFRDGSINVYYRTKIPAGEHHVEINMDDSVRKQGFNHSIEKNISIDPAHILLIEFDSVKGFSIK